MNCRFCGNQTDHLFVSLGFSPLSNSYLAAEQLHKMEPYYPLEVYVCDKCFLVQLDEFESPQNIFTSYAYFSSYSDTWLQHCKGYVEKMVSEFGIAQDSFVVEIASNDGYLLQYFAEKKIPVLGIEPAANVAELAIKKGIPSETVFFGTATAQRLASEGKHADLILGNNVLAHVPDLNDFVGGIKILLKPSGFVTMEFPHLMKLMEQTQFDTIYHEHFSYFSLTTVEKVFNKFGLRLFDVEELPTHGGSLRVYACHDHDSRPAHSRVEELKSRECAAGFTQLNSYLSFGQHVKSLKVQILDFLVDAKKKGKRVVAYGAPAKGNTLLNYCGVDSDLIEYTVDRSPHKQGLYLPGSHIPIYGPEKIAETKPDYVLILPWNLKDEIVSQMSAVPGWGGRFVTFIPGFEVI